MLAKTSRPHISMGYERSRLFDRLDSARRHHSATLVSGPPGAGKTTLVSSYLYSRNLRCLWYQVDSGDEDVATFFHYFSQAARVHLPSGAAPLPQFDAGAATDLKRFSRRYFREFYGELKRPIIVVLDNYQELAEDSHSHDIIETACEEASGDCHIVIASREACPKPLGRKRFSDGLSIIGPEDLVLTIEETRGIAESRGMKPASAAATQALHARSAGWAMGLILMLERARRGDGADAQINLLRAGQEEPAFDYFVGEVFKKLDADCRELLLQSALLPKMSIRRVTQLTGTAKAGALLRELMRRSYFVVRHHGEEPAYQFHPLFREFLLSQARSRYPERDIAFHYCRAAEVLVSDGDGESAIELFEQARDWPRMAEVIKAMAATLKEQGRLAKLEALMQKLPAENIEADPWLLYWHGTSKAFLDSPDSQSILENAYQRFRAIDDLSGVAHSWSGVMEVIHNVHRDFWQVDRWIAEFDVRLKNRLSHLPPDLCARATLGYFIALSFRCPLHPEISSWRERVRKLLELETRAAERPRLRQHLVTHHLLRGEHAQAESVLTMLHYANDLPEKERPSRTPVDYINDAMVAMHVGMAERCLRAVAEGLRAAEGTGNRRFDSVLLQLGAVMCLNRGDLDRADGFLSAFERLAENLPSADRGAYCAVAAWRKFQEGEQTLALQLLGQAVAASEARGTPYYIAIDNLGLGLMLHLCGHTPAALNHLELGRSVGAGIGNLFVEYVYRLFHAHVLLDLGEERDARAHLGNAMRLGHQQGYMHCFFFPPRVIARLCFTALEVGFEPAYVRALIERNGLMPDPAWRQAESWPWPLRIYTLGRFGVVRHGAALRFAGKAQKKPLELLKALIAFGGRDVWEGKLADALWPEAEGDAAAQALATTLFRLRKLIGEDAIHRQEGRLTLDPALCWVDCWAFERLSSDDSAEAPVRLEKLKKLHQGPFLDGVDDAPWARPMRDRLRAKLARLANTVLGMVLLGASGSDKNQDIGSFSFLFLEVLSY